MELKIGSRLEIGVNGMTLTSYTRFLTAILAVASVATAAELWGVSGDGGSPAETLFRLNTTNAAATLILPLGNGADGEVIAFHPNGKVFHWSGATNADYVMEAVDPATLAVTNIPQTGYNHFEIGGAVWDAVNNRFLLSAKTLSGGSELLTATPTGVITQIAAFSGADSYLRPLALIGTTLYGADRDSNSLYKINPATAAVTSTTAIGSGVTGTQALATDPDTGALWAIVKIGAGRQLGTINPATGTFTSVGSVSVNISSISFVVLVPKDSYQVRYVSNLSVGDSFINFSNSGASSTLAGIPAAQNGDICANIYAYSPDEQLVSCCSCNVTPNALNSLSAKNDLASNTLTPIIPSALVVKVLVTAGGSACTASSAASVTKGQLASGFLGWASTLHALPGSGSYGTTETPFAVPSKLSDAELTRMTQLCAFIRSNGSGYGICKSCRVGGLGAQSK
jgi:hypothetical protein